MKISHWISLFFVIVIAIALRFYQLGEVPPSPDWDEVSIGYNAYSMVKTGRDEYGTFLPLTIRSFDDYKPPLYVYLTVPSVALFGLSPWSVRLPSAVMGVLAVLGTYFLVRELFGQKINNREQITKSREQIANNKQQSTTYDLRSTILPITASLLLAISPWHIQFSRIAFEANIGVTINIWAVFLFLLGLRKKVFLPLSAFFFGLGMYAYHSERVFLPLLVIILLIVYRSVIFLKVYRKALIAFLVTGLLVIAPLIPVIFSKSAMVRLGGTSSFREQTEILSDTIKKLEYDQAHGYAVGKIFDNRRIEYAKIIVRGYLVHFSPKWLFVTGDHERHHAPDMGLLYLWELPFLLLGMFMLLKTKHPSFQTSKLLIAWFLISPIAASPTTQLPHAIRTLVFLPTFQIFTAVGIMTAMSKVQSLKSQVGTQNTRNNKYDLKDFTDFRLSTSASRFSLSVLCSLISVLVVFNIFYYLVMYFDRTNPEYSKFWQYGYRQAVEYTESVKDAYDKIVVSTGLEQPYMFYLFYTKYDPALYLKAGGTKSGNFAEFENHFEKYEFRALDWNNEVFDGKTLFVGSSTEIPHGNNANIKFLDGTPAIEIKDRKD